MVDLRPAGGFVAVWRWRARLAVVLSGVLWAGMATSAGAQEAPAWQRAGLEPAQAAAHLLDRFAFGGRPGDVDRLVAMGIDSWLSWQLAGDLPGGVVAGKLARIPTASLDAAVLVRRYPTWPDVVAEATSSGRVSSAAFAGELGPERQRAAQAAVEAFAARRGYRRPFELLADLRAQKLVRAVYSENQLVEVLTDFWFNHFNVSIECHGCAPHILTFERDAIRPRVLGRFRDLLGAVARHPAMLLYLGNAHSVAADGAVTTFDVRKADLTELTPGANPTRREQLVRLLDWRSPAARQMIHDPTRAGWGLNENFARELLELHTLGVDGGYSQADVVAVARAFSGWGIFPPGRGGTNLRSLLATGQTARDAGFVVDGEFLFRADRHDADAKRVLGVELPGGRGIEDGEAVLDLLAAHPATARHLAHKLAARFVSDRPPQALVDRLARVFELSGGDLRQVMRALYDSPELWRDEVWLSKVKTPFELAASALRGLGADLENPHQAALWVTRMGQPLYAYGVPTGFSDERDAWTDVGPLLARVKFAAHVARGGGGIVWRPLDLLGDLDIASVEEALARLHPVILPQRGDSLMTRFDVAYAADGTDDEAGRPTKIVRAQALHQARDAAMLLLASPEFQRR